MVDCNAFEQCQWLKHVGKMMVLVVLAFVGISLWGVVVDEYGPHMFRGSAGSRFGSFIAVATFVGLVSMLLWCYFTAVSTDPGRVPMGWMPFADDEEASFELERIASQRGGEHLTGSSRPRWCRKCKGWKPPRAHHDSVLGRCVLKMDHYCVWIINCVGLLNYKAFLLFLLYASLACTLGSALMIGSFVRIMVDGRGDSAPSAMVLVAFVVDTAFALCLMGFLGMHARLLAANCTTIEMFEKRRMPNWPYDHGFVANFHEVFGRRLSRWFVPYYTEEEQRDLLASVLSSRADDQARLTALAVEL